MKLIQIPAWNDNYAYLVIGQQNHAFVVDPPEAKPVLDVLESIPDTMLVAVVNTHHHGDHVGGNRELVQKTGCEVFGPALEADKIPELIKAVSIGETIKVAGVCLHTIDVRGHTKGHIAFAVDEPFEQVIKCGHKGKPTAAQNLSKKPGVFVGDSLFTAGCGRLFEGEPADLVSVMKQLSTIDPNYLMICAHEYTRNNLQFAAWVLPDNKAILKRLDYLPEEMGASQSCVPSTFAQELETNPFLLVLKQPNMQNIAQKLGCDTVELEAVMGALRIAKDGF